MPTRYLSCFRVKPELSVLELADEKAAFLTVGGRFNRI
jgi:hypothetical protein